MLCPRVVGVLAEKNEPFMHCTVCGSLVGNLPGL